jgi:hypothetical protein
MAHGRIMRGGAAGAAAATVWAAQEPLDMRVFGVRYSDTELLGRAVARKRWREAGWAMHAANGFVFGAAYALVRSRLGFGGVAAGAAAGMTEHLATWPLTRFVPRWHPQSRRIPKLYGDHAAFAQAVWRHLLFGALLGALEERLNSAS